MARPDTAGFYYYGPFYGHSKTQIVPGGDDTGPVDNPTTPRNPCDDCPTGYTCVDGECVDSGGTHVLKPQPINLSSPTTDTDCYTYSVTGGSGIKTTASGVFSGYDENSGGNRTFICYSKIIFYGRLNHGLLNDIRWGAGNHYRSFTVPTDSIDEQSIFRFTEYADGRYTIEVKRKASGNTYYDWQLYQQGVLEEADGIHLFVGVSSNAQIWFNEPAEPKIVPYYEGGNGIIYRDTLEGTIVISVNGGDTITIADKNLGATDAGTGQESYGDTYDAWDMGDIVVPDGYHIPSLEEYDSLIQAYLQIVGGSTPDPDKWEEYLKMPYHQSQYGGLYGTTTFRYDGRDRGVLEVNSNIVRTYFYANTGFEAYIRLFKNN